MSIILSYFLENIIFGRVFFSELRQNCSKPFKSRDIKYNSNMVKKYFLSKIIFWLPTRGFFDWNRRSELANVETLLVLALIFADFLENIIFGRVFFSELRQNCSKPFKSRDIKYNSNMVKKYFLIKIIFWLPTRGFLRQEWIFSCEVS